MKSAYAEQHYRTRIWRAYNAGRIDNAAMESLIGHVVAGGHLDRHLRPIDVPEPGSALAAEYERERRNGQRLDA